MNMHIGIAFDLRPDEPTRPDLPDDWAEEFDSPATVEAIAAALRAHGHTVSELGDGRPFIEKLLAAPPDLVFNIAEGVGVGRSREARVPALCEMLGVPYTGSDPLTLAATLDKDVARRLVTSAGVDVPHGAVLSRGEPFCPDRMRFPVIVKPAWEGSSKGIRDKSVAITPAEVMAALDEQFRGYQQPVLVEEFIAGDELTVGIVGNDPPRVLGVMRILPNRPDEHFVYSLEVKRDWRNRVRYECPARLPTGASERVEAAALKAYQALGCRDVARIDFRLRDGAPFFIEANPLPGLSPETGDLVILAGRAGIGHAELINMIVEAALRRLNDSRETLCDRPAS
jgi:D-alanine-D-alanine ligase